MADALREQIKAVLSLSCHHCGRMPEVDGDHTCACPNSHSGCLQHTVDPVVALLPIRAALTESTTNEECPTCTPHPEHGRLACRKNGDLCGCPGATTERPHTDG
jgi:hypothetical protein